MSDERVECPAIALRCDLTGFRFVDGPDHQTGGFLAYFLVFISGKKFIEKIYLVKKWRFPEFEWLFGPPYSGFPT